MRRFSLILIVLVALIVVNGCGSDSQEMKTERIKVGVMLSDGGLGDQSFSDGAFAGLVKARDEINIEFIYREHKDSPTLEQGFAEFIGESCDLIIGIGFNVKEALEKIAQEHPDQQFIIVDEMSDLANVTSITFKDDEGSFIVGLVAGLKTKTNVVGFIGGMDVPVIQRFEKGFVAGVHAANPQARVISQHVGDFGDPDLGAQMTGDMIVQKHVDIVFAAAGLSGVGALEEAQKRGKYAIGVDSDQFFVAEKAVITSMLKSVDVAIYSALKEYVEQGKLSEQHMRFGIREDGVSMAPIRIIDLTPKELDLIEKYKQQLLDGKIKIPDVTP